MGGHLMRSSSGHLALHSSGHLRRKSYFFDKFVSNAFANVTVQYVAGSGYRVKYEYLDTPIAWGSYEPGPGFLPTLYGYVGLLADSEPNGNTEYSGWGAVYFDPGNGTGTVPSSGVYGAATHLISYVISGSGESSVWGLKAYAPWYPTNKVVRDFGTVTGATPVGSYSGLADGSDPTHPAAVLVL